jgi:Ca2+-binding RTX toxin-like protein
MKHPCIDTLESRRLLSAVLKNGTLTVIGTDHRDKINFWIDADHHDRLIVLDGVGKFSFDRSKVDLISAMGGLGDDDLAALNIGGEVDIPMILNGGKGNDFISGGSANDTLIGFSGDDTLFGGAGIDVADYSYVTKVFHPKDAKLNYGLVATLDMKKNDGSVDGTDNIEDDVEGIIGTGFRDVITGNGRNNTLIGAGGADQIFGLGGNDSLVGEGGNNFLSGGDGKDTLIGGNGSSTLDGNGGNDIMLGGSGNDTMDGGTGFNTYDGKGGFDTADFTGLTGGFRLTFDGKANDGPHGHDDNFIEIDKIITTGDGDRVNAVGLQHGITYFSSGHGAVVRGTNFKDHIKIEDGEAHGMGGSDLIQTGLNGSTTKSVVFGDDGNDTITTGEGDDAVDGGAGNDSISTGDGNDVITGDDGNDTIIGASGDDSIRGGAGNDSLIGEDGNDTVLGDGGKDFIVGGTGKDVFFRSDNEDGFVKDFEDGVDQLTIIIPKPLGP